MKKLFLLVVTVMLAFGCSSDDSTTPTNPGSENPGTENPENPGNPENPQNPENPGELGCNNPFFGHIVLESQAEVNEFVAHQYCAIYGSVRIGNPLLTPYESDIIDISGLQNLNEVSESITIYNTRLVNLHGLENLIRAGSITLLTNVYLETLEHLHSLKEVGSYNSNSSNGIRIWQNTGLSTLKGLDHIKELTKLEISGTAITNLNGLASLQKAKKISFIGNNELVNFDGLNSITYIDELIVESNDKLMSVQQLDNLQNLSQFSCFFNPMLTVLPQMNKITELKKLSISGVPVVSFTSFPNVTNITDIAFIGNSQLTSFPGLSNLKTVSGLRIGHCPGLTSLIGLSGITNFIYNVESEFNGIDIRQLNITSLEGFQNIESFSGSIKIMGNSQLLDYCDITEITDQATYYNVTDNAYNPTKEDILAGNCSQ